MFKWTGTSGLRRSGGRPSQPRVITSPGYGICGSDITLTQRRRPAFMPDTPEEQGFDSNTSRVNETA